MLAAHSREYHRYDGAFRCTRPKSSRINSVRRRAKIFPSVFLSTDVDLLRAQMIER